MKQLFLIAALSIALSNVSTAQKYFTKNGKITFFSKAPVENIEAVNNQVLSVLDINTGDLAFSVLIKGFLFKKALMQEHFNENYMESDKFPKSTFKGNISDIKKIDLTKDGSYAVIVNGELSIHGIAKKTSANGTIVIKAGKISATSDFTVLLEDYHIAVPKLLINNISKTIKISVGCNYELKK